MTKDKNRNDGEVEHQAEPEAGVSDDDGEHQADWSELLVDENGDILKPHRDEITVTPWS